MNWTNIGIGLLLISLGITGVTLYGTLSNHSYVEEFKEREYQRKKSLDSLLYLNDSLVKVNDSLSSQLTLFKEEVDGTLVIISDLTKPVVTEEVVNEALLWIEKHDSL